MYNRLAALPLIALLGIAWIGAAEARTATVSGLKTAGACEDEYKANKGALKDAKEKKKDFIAACRALAPGTATPIGTAGASPAAPPAQQAAPVEPAPAPVAPPASAPAAQTARPQPTRAAPAPAASGANEFPAEASAKARCPGATVVWVNTKSKVYHFAGTKNYGNTKAGAYMCENDATAAGDRASMTERHP